MVFYFYPLYFMSGLVTAVSFHSSGDFMLTGCNNGMLALWDLNSQRCLSRLCRWNNIDRVHKGAIANCQIIPHSNLSITASEDGDVRLWDLRTVEKHFTALRYGHCG